jgi:hypothetical protein
LRGSAEQDLRHAHHSPLEGDGIGNSFFSDRANGLRFAGAIRRKPYRRDFRQMTPGETARFGNIEVQVQTSANRSSAKPYLEGPPYAVRLQVRSVQ